MGFKFHISAVSRLSRTVAGAIFVTGLGLIGFGFMIYLLPELFATLAAIVFFFAGGCCTIAALRILFTRRRLYKTDSDYSQTHRKNIESYTVPDDDR